MQLKNKNMKQLFPLFLFLLPCLAWAQYSSNGNQKITLGEQTTADGLIWRGVLADTGIINPLSDTSAYIILDTVNHRFYNYNRATNVWSVAGGGTSVTTFSGGTTGLTPNTATSGAVTLAGTLAVANGGTNTTTLTANKVMVGNGTSGVLTPTNLHWDNTNSRLGIGTTEPKAKLNVVGTTYLGAVPQYLGVGIPLGDNNVILTSSSFGANNNQNGGSNLGFAGRYYSDDNGQIQWASILGAKENANNAGSTGYMALYTNPGNDPTERLRITSSGKVGIGTPSPDVQFHTTGGVRFATFAGGGISTLSVDNNGDLARTSSIELKNNITNIKYGLSDILKINPINFNWKDENKFGDINENGFIAEDVYTIIPNVVSSDNNGIFMDYTKLIPILTKAIQEQQALIKALEQRIINLENK
jgi:hypothetical protein